MKILAIVALLSLTACVDRNQCIPSEAPKQDVTIAALKDYTCTADEMRRVESESVFCNKNTSFFSDYCYGSAIIRNCKLKETK